MKRIAILAALALAGCTPGGLTSVPKSPSVVADKTVLDESALWQPSLLTRPLAWPWKPALMPA